MIRFKPWHIRHNHKTVPRFAPRPKGIASAKPRSRLMQRNVKPLASAIWHPMFDFDQPLLVAGMLLGLSSSLHCFGMCSGIAASLHFAADLDPRRSQTSLFATTSLINAGRIAGYVIAGAIVGGIGSGVFGAFDHSVSHAILRWAAAAALAAPGRPGGAARAASPWARPRREPTWSWSWVATAPCWIP